MAEPLLFAHAMQVGRLIDLAGCGYGEPHWLGKFVSDPPSYYCLLAGLVRAQRLTHILELGTHFGGAIMAMSRGLHPADLDRAQLVTVDVTHRNDEGFKPYPHIKRITGDCLDGRIVAEVARLFDRPIDLCFVDTVHDYRQTYRNIALYANRLRPRYIVLDDIRLNASMQRLWRDVQARLGKRAVDVSELCERNNAGFGVLVADRNDQWLEKYSRWEVYWRFRRRVSALVRGSARTREKQIGA
jgi:predicted O-methyltransferase YrrM